MSERRIKYVPIGELRPDPRNPKGHAKELLSDSIDRFGYVEPIVVDGRTGLLSAGHGRVEHLREMAESGQVAPDGVTVRKDGEWTVPVVVGWESKDDDEAYAWLIAANHVGEVGGWIEHALAEGLGKLADKELLLGTGFSANDVTDLLAKLAGAPSLDDLANQYGDPAEDDLWPVLRFKVPPHVRDWWYLLTKNWEGGDAEHFERVLDLAEKGLKELGAGPVNK